MPTFSAVKPPENCPKCPRLCQFREENRRKYPTFFNDPVPAFGDISAQLLVVGLAPGLKGANQTGRPFTGDYAGIILYGGLLKEGFAKGHYNPDSFIRHSRDCVPRSFLAKGEGGNPGLPTNEPHGMDPGLRRDDSLKLINCRITNAVRCVPQENKPEPSEIKNCNVFLQAEIAAMPQLKAILSLGLISHNAVLRALGYKISQAKFSHGAMHKVGHITLFDSYHCSRYNINTGRLTQAMFDQVLQSAKAFI